MEQTGGTPGNLRAAGLVQIVVGARCLLRDPYRRVGGVVDPDDERSGYLGGDRHWGFG